MIGQREYEKIYPTALELVTSVMEEPIDISEVDTILGRRTASGLSPRDVARLLNCLRSKEFSEIARKVEFNSQILRNSLYGNRYSTMAPLEIG